MIRKSLIGAAITATHKNQGTLDAPRVHNKYHNTAPPDAVYIGRGSLWGNPWVIGVHGTREEVIRIYEKALMPGDIERIRRELKGKHLVCFCKPAACHGDILLRIANEE